MIVSIDGDRIRDWEAEWEFPPVGYKVSIGLAGDREGPSTESRAFFLSRVAEFERTVELVRPQLDSVCRKWLGRPLADDIWADVKLAGLDVQDPNGTPLSWEVSFETLGNRWLGIAIPIVGDVVGEAIVDT